MKIIQHVAGATAVVLAAFASIPANAQTRVPVSVTIKTADLNLSHVEGRDALRRRIGTAARTACGGGNSGTVLRALSDTQRCYREMMADGTQKIAALAGTPAVEVANLDRR